MTLEKIMISALDAEIEQHEELLKSLPEPSFSLKHGRVIAEALRIADQDLEECRKEPNQRHRTSVRRVVVAALVAVLIMVSSAVTFAKVHPECYMVIEEKEKDWVSSFITENEDTALNDFAVKKGALPEKFVLVSEASEAGLYTAEYKNSETGEEISYVQEAISEYSIAGFDAEKNHKKIVWINGNKTIFIEKNGAYTLFWVKDGCSYTLAGNCRQNVLKEYAESLG